MFEQAILAERFASLLTEQQSAERMYADLVPRITDPRLREQIEQLHREKQRHIELTERLLEIVA
jgi:rubrerythrin